MEETPSRLAAEMLETALLLREPETVTAMLERAHGLLTNSSKSLLPHPAGSASDAEIPTPFPDHAARRIYAQRKRPQGTGMIAGQIDNALLHDARFGADRWRLALLLGRTYGPDAYDGLAHAFASSGTGSHHPCGDVAYEKAFLGGVERADRGDFRGFLETVFGSDAVNAVRAGTPAEVDQPLRSLMMIDRKSREVRQSAAQAFRRWVYTPVRTLFTAMVAEGWRQLEDMPEVTDAESFKKRRQTEKELKQPEVLRSGPPRFLKDVLRCEERRRTLEECMAMQHMRRLGAEELSVLYGTYGLLQNVPYATHEARESALPGYAVGTPRHAVTERAFNCFTGPWTMAALCAKAGFPLERLFLAEAEYPDFIAGGHTALIAKTANNDVVLTDVSRQYSAHLYLGMVDKEQMRVELNALLCGNRSDPVVVEFRDDWVKFFHWPKRLRVMRPFQRTAAVMALHTGLSLAADGNEDAARMAYELGTTYDPDDPHLQLQLGQYAFRRGDLDEAETLLHAAIRTQPSLHHIHFFLGELALARGNTELARQQFTAFVGDKRGIFGDDGSLRGSAQRYLGMTDGEMLGSWQARSEQMEAD